MQQVDATFQSALELAAGPRDRFLADIASTDPELRAQVDSLLRAYREMGDFIEDSAADVAASLIDAKPAAPVRVGSYTLVEPLGAGGMGRVYVAKDRLNRSVALKLLAPSYLRDGNQLARFLREGRALVALNHPNVVTVYDVGESEGVYYIASELVEGRTLRRALEEGRLDPATLVDVAIQIAAGVAAAHDKGIVHRDIKPENVMIRTDGFVKVLDFGIAKLTDDFGGPLLPGSRGRADTTHEGLVVGTLAYMSPEQARGGAIDQRTDVWSLGAVLYEMLAARTPFGGNSAADVVAAILQSEPQRIEEDVPEELRRIVAKALAKNPESRYTTMREMRADLEALARELVFAARGTRGPVARQRRLSALFQSRLGRPAVAVALGLCGVVGFVLWRTDHALPVHLPTRSIAVLPFAAMGEDPRLRHVAGALVEELLNDLAGQRQMKVASRTATSAKPPDQTLPAFVNRLGVSYALEGSVQPTKDGNRATVQLIRGEDGLHLWSQTLEFGREIVDLERVARQIALRAFLFVDNDVHIAAARLQTKNDDAFTHYERAFRMDPSGVEPDSHEVGVGKRLANYNKAIELDPDFAEPYIERAFLDVGGGPQRVAEAQRSLARYLELRPDSARAVTLLGVMQASGGDLVAAEKTLRHACELEPDFPWPYNVLGELEMWRGRPRQAADYFKQAISNDSARPSHYNYGMALLALGEFAEADRQFEIWEQIEPDDPAAASARVVTAKLQGFEDDARQRFDSAWARFGKAAPEQFLMALVMMGHEPELRELMRQWDAGTRPSSPALWFLAYNALGEYDAAIDWLLRAIDQGVVPSVRVEGLFPQLHRQPRFAEVLARLDAKDKLRASEAMH